MSKIKPVWFAEFLWVSIIGTLLHFTYEWSDSNPFIGLFSAVNESIWEHLKLLFFPAALFALAIFPFFRKKYTAILTCCAAAIIIAMLLQTTVYYTYSGIVGKDIPAVNIILFYVCSAVNAILSCYFVKRNPNTGSLWGLAIFCGISICFFYFTKNPPEFGIFADPLQNTIT